MAYTNYKTTNYNKVDQINQIKNSLTRMWDNAQRDGRPAEYRWCRLFNAAKFG